MSLPWWRISVSWNPSPLAWSETSRTPSGLTVQAAEVERLQRRAIPGLLRYPHGSSDMQNRPRACQLLDDLFLVGPVLLQESTE